MLFMKKAGKYFTQTFPVRLREVIMTVCAMGDLVLSQ